MSWDFVVECNQWSRDNRCYNHAFHMSKRWKPEFFIVRCAIFPSQKFSRNFQPWSLNVNRLKSRWCCEVNWAIAIAVVEDLWYVSPPRKCRIWLTPEEIQQNLLLTPEENAFLAPYPCGNLTQNVFTLKNSGGLREAIPEDHVVGQVLRPYYHA